MRSITKLDLQYAHRFYGFKGEAQYLPAISSITHSQLPLKPVWPVTSTVFPL